MKNTRGEPSAGGQTAPRETLPISCLFVLFRSLRVVRAANIVTMDKLHPIHSLTHTAQYTTNAAAPSCRGICCNDRASVMTGLRAY